MTWCSTTGASALKRVIRGWRAALPAWAFSAALLACGPTAAVAHAIILESEPAAGAKLTEPPALPAFPPDDKPFTSVTLPILYKQITELEYGQKAGRRVGVALATGLLLTPLGLVCWIRWPRWS